MCRFLWTGKESGRYLAKVSWNVICTPWDRGRLSIKTLKLHNQGLLLKWFWKLRSDRGNSLWSHVISSYLVIDNWHDLVSSSRL